MHYIDDFHSRRTLRSLLIAAFGMLAVVLAFGPHPAIAAPPAADAIRITGILTTATGDSEDFTSTVTQSWLTDDQQVTYQLLIDANRALALNGRRVSMLAVPISAEPSQPSDPPVLSVLDVQPDQTVQSHGMVPNAVTGSQPWVNVLCRFSDSTNVTPNPLTYYDELLGAQAPGMDHYWREMSYNTVNLVGSMSVGWVDLPNPRSAYVTVNQNGDTVVNLANLAKDCTSAVDASVNFQAFAGINMAFNQVLDCCAWGGTSLLQLDGMPARIFRTTWLPPWAQKAEVVAHEMGHGFGMPHSSGPYGAVYDSNWDVMSSGGTCAQLNPKFGCVPAGTIAYHRMLTGWIPPARQFIGSGPATLRLERLDLPQSATDYLVARVPIPASSRYYTVEVRQLVGYDANAAAAAVVIHQIDTSRESDAWVVDADGNGNTNDGGSRWLVGETFVDAANNIRIGVVKADATGYVITINSEIGGPTNLALQTVSNTQINLTWVDNASDETAFRIEHSFDGSTGWVEVGTTGANITSFSNTGLGCGSHFYRVRAYRSTGNALSSYSNVATVTPCAKVFADVPTLGKEWMHLPIEHFYTLGITSGCAQSPLRYCPEESVTRGAMAVFLMRAMKYPNLPYTPTDTEPDIFTDVPSAGKEWMEPWIEEFYTLGITDGCGVAPQRFCPENVVTRAAMAVFILRAIEGPGYTPPTSSNIFADLPIAGKEWMEPWVNEFYNRGYTTGCNVSPLRYCPENPVTRGAMAVFILRAFDNLPQP